MIKKVSTPNDSRQSGIRRAGRHLWKQNWRLWRGEDPELLGQILNFWEYQVVIRGPETNWSEWDSTFGTVDARGDAYATCAADGWRLLCDRQFRAWPERDPPFPMLSWDVTESGETYALRLVTGLDDYAIVVVKQRGLHHASLPPGGTIDDHGLNRAVKWAERSGALLADACRLVMRHTSMPKHVTLPEALSHPDRGWPSTFEVHPHLYGTLKSLGIPEKLWPTPDLQPQLIFASE